jgi:ankyrin repeat protein
VRARFQEIVEIAALELQPETHVPFPSVRDWNSLKIVLERKWEPSAYRVEIHGDGSVVYSASCENERPAKRGQGTWCSGDPLIVGEHHEQISQDAVSQLVESFHRADFFSLQDEYTYLTAPVGVVSITFDGYTKLVGDAWGRFAGMPQVMTDLENAIDDAVGIEKWIHGNAETVPSLEREGWNFQSWEAANTLLRSVTEARFFSVASDLVTAGVPADLVDNWGECTLYYAAMHGDEKLIDLLLRAGTGKRHRLCENRALLMAASRGKLQAVRALIADGANVHFRGDEDPLSDETLLQAAAESNNPQVVAEALKHHLNVNAQDGWGNTALMYASESSPSPYVTSDDREADLAGKPQIAEMLLHAGASPRRHSKEGYTALHRVVFPAVARLLIAAGADINARNHDGETPLIVNESSEVVTLLLQSGADPSATDKDGHDALWAVRDLLGGPDSPVLYSENDSSAMAAILLGPKTKVHGHLLHFVNLPDRESNLREKMRILQSWTHGVLSQKQ